MHKLKPDHIRLEKHNRLYQCPVPIVAITGSIATGKSSVSEILKDRGYPVIDADLLIKKIYMQNDVIDLVAKESPEAMVNDKINFKVLRAQFFSKPQLKKRLEEKLYSYLKEFFLKEARLFLATGAQFVFYDVPLLFEKKIDSKVDLIAVVYCNKETQVERLTKRDDIDESYALKLISNQIDIDEKKSKSHLVIDNQGDLKHLRLEVESFLQNL